MKNFYTFLYLTLSTAAFAQWNSYDFSTSAIISNGSIAEHKGKLFVSNYDNKLMVSSDGGTTFTDITTDTIPGEIRWMVDGGSRLYLSLWNPNYASSVIWYTTDEGSSWHTDTVGLPYGFFGKPNKAGTSEFYSYNNGSQLILNVDAVDGYYRKAVTDTSWTKMTYLANVDPDWYAFNGDTVITTNSNGFHFSDDNGITWSAISSTGLPSYYVTRGLAYANGKIYLAADNTIQQKFSLLYSSDFGATWDTSSINHLLTTNNFGQSQRPYIMEAFGSQVFVSLYNNKSNTPINVVSSTDGGLTFSHDTTGFKTDGFGTGLIKKFVNHQGKVFALNNFQTLYSKSLSSVSIKELRAEFDIYPNPASDYIFIDAGEAILEKIEILNIEGKVVKQLRNPSTGRIIINDLPKGIYFVCTEQGIKKLILQ